MDQEYIEILNQCIVSVEDILESYSYEDFPYFLLILDKPISGNVSVTYKRGTRSAPARLDVGDIRPRLLIKDVHDFDHYWSHISNFGKCRKMEFPDRVPTFTADELAGSYSMIVELLCRSITKSLAPGAHTRMWGL